MRSITIEELEEWKEEDRLVVDLRPQEQYERGTFPGAVNIPLDEFSDRKSSLLLAKLIQELQRHGKIHFDAVFLVMNPGYNADNWKIIQENAKLLGIPLTVFERRMINPPLQMRGALSGGNGG